MLKKVLVAASTLVVALVTLTLVALLGTVTHADAVGYSDWIDATQVTNPLPGQLYAISADGEIEGQLCPLSRDDFRIDTDALPGRTFVNRLGETVPVVVWIARIYFQTGQPGEPADRHRLSPAMARPRARVRAAERARRRAAADPGRARHGADRAARVGRAGRRAAASRGLRQRDPADFPSRPRRLPAGAGDQRGHRPHPRRAVRQRTA